MEVRPIDANALIDKLDSINPVDYGSMSSYETHTGARDALSDAIRCVSDAPTLSLNTLRDEIYQDAVAHGLWEDADRRAGCWAFAGEELIRKNLWNTAAQMVKSEAYELAEVSANDIYDGTDSRDGFIEELADVVIMCFSVAGKLGIDIDAAIRRKMEINKGRAWKHGKE